MLNRCFECERALRDPKDIPGLCFPCRVKRDKIPGYCYDCGHELCEPEDSATICAVCRDESVSTMADRTHRRGIQTVTGSPGMQERYFDHDG